MQNRTIRTLVLFAALLLVASPALAQGADFTKYVAVGDSLSAGFLNGGLLAAAQQRSFPALIARQAGVADFQLPLAGAPGIPPLLAIQGFQGGSPVIMPRAAQPGAPLNLNLPRPYDNLAVPGYTTSEALNVVSDPANPLSDLVLRGLGTQVEQALVQQPTFATIWLGNNDVLGAAVSGIVIEGVTLTPRAEFLQAYRTIVGAFAQSGVQLAVANIVDVTAIPYVDTIPPFVVDPATGQPVLGPDGQPIPLLGPNGPMTPEDKVLLPASALLAQGIGIPAQLGGTGMPLPNEVHLSASEVADIRFQTAAFNAIIAGAAQDFGAALVDINGFFNRVKANGYQAGGNIEFTAEFITGGIFSYDGVHPTPLGYAVVANEFIDAINATYGDSIPRVSLIPFIFGPDGSAGATVPLPGLENGATFSPAAAASLYAGLGLPSIEELLKQDPGGDAGDDAPGLGVISGAGPSGPSSLGVIGLD